MKKYKTAWELELLPQDTFITYEDATSITYKFLDGTRHYWDVRRETFYHIHRNCNKGHSKTAAERIGVAWNDGYKTRGLGYVFIYYTSQEQLHSYYQAYQEVCVEARHSEPVVKVTPVPRVKKAPKPVKRYRCFVLDMPQFEEQTIEALSYQKAKEQYEKSLEKEHGRIFYTSGACFDCKAKEIK